MSRGQYSLGKRQRENERARKKKEKAARRAEKRERGPQEVPVTTHEEIVSDLPTVDEAMRAMMNDGGESRSATPIPCRLFVGGLSWDTTSDGLRQAFEPFGDVAEAIIVTDRDTGRSRGFGFVTMANRKDANRAMGSLTDSELDGRRIIVNVATER